ncbi:MAG: hypothetical protein L0G99_11535, partial [Propionibacteriales bacterium]|nr:hypothetical protein [Propionibacteriales bacterium]
MSQSPYRATDALARLRAWRQSGGAEQRPGFAAIRDIHLSMVARSGRRTDAAIAEILPASLKGFAGGMAQALNQKGTPNRAQPGAAQPGAELSAAQLSAAQPPPTTRPVHPTTAGPDPRTASAAVRDPRLAPDPGSAAAPGRPAGRPHQPQAPAPSAIGPAPSAP